ncbi:hypothetical protein [Niveibacterium sp.]|uniref:hypothetical protein n=1 Tax=Niveibacterium sp. TaxID=2017444 RepID=UPI0035B37933
MQEELYASRDRAYSAWHRRLSTRRYVGIERAARLSMIDLDGALFVEYDDETREPLALIETARDVGQRRKVSTVTARLAMRAHVPAYCVLYRLAMHPNPADPTSQDIDQFRVKRIWPRPDPEWRILSPNAWAHALLSVRDWSSSRLDQQAANDPQWTVTAP